MDLRQLLRDIASTYDRSLGNDQQALGLLAAAGDHLAHYVPVTHVVRGSAGVGGLPFVPWIAVLDPDETNSPQRGMYVVYLFAADRKTIFLSLNQGTDDLRHRNSAYHGNTKISKRALLSAQAEAIRNRVDVDLRGELLAEIDLRAPKTSDHPRNYEAANILATAYDVDDLPVTADLHTDLRKLLELYAHAMDVRTRIALSEPEAIATRKPYRHPDPPAAFKPTDGSDYQVRMRARTSTRSRKNVSLLAAVAGKLTDTGFFPSNQGIHPRDLTTTRDGTHWLIEVKVVRQGDGQRATREAVAQLLEYRRFCYPARDRRDVRMLAVFSESIGAAFVEHLESLDVASLWMDGTTWAGSPMSRSAGFCS